MKAKKIFAANGSNAIIFVKVSGEFVMKSGLYQTRGKYKDAALFYKTIL